MSRSEVEAERQLTPANLWAGESLHQRSASLAAAPKMRWLHPSPRARRKRCRAPRGERPWQSPRGCPRSTFLSAHAAHKSLSTDSSLPPAPGTPYGPQIEPGDPTALPAQGYQEAEHTSRDTRPRKAHLLAQRAASLSCGGEENGRHVLEGRARSSCGYPGAGEESWQRRHGWANSPQRFYDLLVPPPGP